MKQPLSILLTAMLGTAALAQSPVGGEFRVNTYTTNNQMYPQVAMDGGGDFVVVWQSNTQGSTEYDVVMAQTFNSFGQFTNSEFQVNTYTTTLLNYQNTPAVAMNASGAFMVTWQSWLQDGSDYAAMAQQYDADQTNLGDEFQVNTYTPSCQSTPVVALNDSSSFIVVWQTPDVDGKWDLAGQLYDSFGTNVADQFLVNSYTTNNQDVPGVGMDSSGNFVVTWQSGDSVSGYNVKAQIYNSDGSNNGPEFQINAATSPGYFSPWPAVAMNDDFFVITWQSLPVGGGDSKIHTQVFSPDGTNVNKEFVFDGTGYRPDVAMDSAGDFIVVWENDFNIYGQLVNSDGTEVGDSNFQINTSSAYNRLPAVTMDQQGDRFTVAWQNLGQDGSGYGVYAQFYNIALFESGFESGNTADWSITVGTR